MSQQRLSDSQKYKSSGDMNRDFKKESLIPSRGYRAQSVDNENIIRQLNKAPVQKLQGIMKKTLISKYDQTEENKNVDEKQTVLYDYSQVKQESLEMMKAKMDYSDFDSDYDKSMDSDQLDLQLDPKIEEKVNKLRTQFHTEDEVLAMIKNSQVRKALKKVLEKEFISDFAGERVLKNGRILDAFIKRHFINSQTELDKISYKPNYQQSLGGPVSVNNSTLQPGNSGKPNKSTFGKSTQSQASLQIPSYSIANINKSTAFKSATDSIWKEEEKSVVKEEQDDVQQASDNDQTSQLSTTSNKFNMDKIKKLMILKRGSAYQQKFQFKRNHLIKLIFDLMYVEDQKFSKLNKDLIGVYINEHFYDVNDVEFIFWMLLKFDMTQQAIHLYENNRQRLHQFIEYWQTEITSIYQSKYDKIGYFTYQLIQPQIEKIQEEMKQGNKKLEIKIKVDMEDFYLQLIPKIKQGLLWAFKKAIEYNVSSLIKYLFDEEFIKIKAEISDQYYEECRIIAKKACCVKFYQIYFKKIKKNLEDLDEEMEQFLSNPINDEIEFISVYFKKIKKVQTKSKYEQDLKIFASFQQKMASFSEKKKSDLKLSKGVEEIKEEDEDDEDDDQYTRRQKEFSKNKKQSLIVQQQTMKEQKIKTKSDQLSKKIQNQLTNILMHPQFLFNPQLSEKLTKLGAFDMFIQIVKERISRMKEIKKLMIQELLVNDLRILLRVWDRINHVIMHEFTKQILKQRYYASALTDEKSQRNIIKIMLTNVYNGIELLARVPISSWSSKLDKELLNAFDSHLKEPNQIIYSLKPLIVIVLMKEFLDKLKQKTYKYQNKCDILGNKLLQLGRSFVYENKSEDLLKFFVDQKDTLDRSALEIMSKYRYYQMLESNQMGLIIQEKWQGLNSQNFGLLQASQFFKILSTDYDDYEEIKRLSIFRNPKNNELLHFHDYKKKTDNRIYLFQYYLWPHSCFVRYTFLSFTYLILAALELGILVLSVQKNGLEDTHQDQTIKWLYIASFIWISSFNLFNVQVIIYSKLLGKKFRLTYGTIIDLLILILEFLNSIDVAELAKKYEYLHKYKFSSEVDVLRKNFNLFTNCLIMLFVWIRISNFAIATQHFGVYIRMISNMFKTLLVFIIIWGGWIFLCSQVFTLLFYNDNEDFTDQYKTVITLINSSFNNFDATKFERSQLFGRYLFLSSVAVSSLFLMNMIVAMLNGIYQVIVQKTEADYHACLITEESYLRFNRKYGLFVFSQPPLNLIGVLLMPILLLIDRYNGDLSIRKTQKINNLFQKIIYFPIAIILFVIIFISNIIFAPFVYVKIFIMRIKSERRFLFAIIKAFIWLLQGIIVILILMMKDCIKFWKLLYLKTDTFKKKELQLNPQIKTVDQQKKYFEVRQDVTKKSYDKFVQEYFNDEQVQKFGKFISKKEIFSLSYIIREKRDELEKELDAIKQKKNGKKNVIPIKILRKKWKQINLKYEMEKATEHKVHKYKSQKTKIGNYIQVEVAKLVQKSQEQRNQAKHKQIRQQIQEQKEEQKEEEKILETNGTHAETQQDKVDVNQQEIYQEFQEEQKEFADMTEEFLKKNALQEKFNKIKKSLTQAVFEEFLAHISDQENSIDLDKLKRVLYDEDTMYKMSDQDFEEYRLRLFNTNLSLLEKAIGRAKQDQKANKLENKYMSGINMSSYEISKFIDDYQDRLHEISVLFSVVDFKKMEAMKPEEIFNIEMMKQAITQDAINNEYFISQKDQIIQGNLGEIELSSDNEDLQTIDKLQISQRLRKQRTSITRYLPIKSARSFEASRTQILDMLNDDLEQIDD
ncbi:UNKNOWN [Stylonychia lemnae]|uniref:Uncharacterized protein n=1 Tax=Stylonychia lemnae TaxID=5949 RepID=A0A077ZZ36_STYLE|nr:UNKNOWN [Stylonychia lemnae]|eukprot:CDW74832.1 UNKNOWN [Stylonychia lemnae]